MFDEDDWKCSLVCFAPNSTFFRYIKSLSLFWWALVVFVIPWSFVWWITNWAGILPRADNFLLAFSDLTIIFTVFLIEYVRRAWQTYTSSIELYHQMLERTHTLTMDIFAAIEYVNSEGAVLLSPECGETIHNIKVELDSMLYNITMSFMPYKSSEIVHPRLNSIQHGGGSYIQECRNSILNIKIWIGELEAMRCIKSAGGNDLRATSREISSIIGKIDTGNSVNDLDAIYLHTVIVIGFYFLFIIPYKLTLIGLGWLIFIFYPFLIFAMAGIIFIRKYVGSPFRRVPVFQVNPVGSWYDKFLTLNQECYSKWLTAIQSGVEKKKQQRIDVVAAKGQQVNMEFSSSHYYYVPGAVTMAHMPVEDDVNF